MKKGFTLIELLAVIVILAIITLIAVPMILGVVETAKIGAAESSATGYVKAVEHSFINNLFIGGSYDGEYDVIDNELGVKIKGTGPSKGFFVVENNEVKYGEFCINGYGIKYENSISKYSPDEVTCDGNNEIIFVEPEGEEITKLCNGEINYDEVTNFKVKKVEDLVCVSKLSSEGKTFEGKKIMLLSNIDINDNNSYININDTTYGDINGNGIIEGIKVELTTEKGFLPIGSSKTPFKGTFEGYTFTLSNIMINRPTDDNVGLFGCNAGTILALNIEGINVKGKNSVGGIVGYLSKGVIKDITYKGTVEGISYVGGITGYNYFGQINNILAKESNVIGLSLSGGIVGYPVNTNANIITAVLESGKLGEKVSRVSSAGYGGLVLISDAVEANNTQGTTYTSDDINNLGYYSSLTYNDKPILESATTGDVDESGYYFAYGNDGYIKVVKVGETTNIIAGLYPIDDNYTMSSIVGTTDTTAPTCELHYVRAVTNGIQASFSCTDDSGAPTVKSLFDSTTSKSASTFDAIGTTKSGSVSGNTKTVVSTWNTYNTISQPTPGTCYYFRYGAQDIEGNFSTYVTDLCYTGFSS